MQGLSKKPGLNIFYPDPDFRLHIRPDSTSFIDDPDQVSKALHEEIELKYFYEGSSTLLIGTETVVAEAGDLVAINPYELHSTIRFGENRGEYHMIIMDLDFLFDGSAGGIDLRRILYGGRAFTTLIKGDVRIGDIFRRVIEVYKTKPPYYKLSLRGLMLELFAILLGEYCTDTESDCVYSNVRYFETVEPAIQRIRDGYSEKITVDGLAHLCRVSKCHFCRIFRKATGVTAMQYLTDYRLKVADVMLASTTKSIAEISELCGFEDEGYFCRCYKKKYGEAPGKKRNNRIM